MSSTKITPDELDHIAKLARIKLSDSEKKTFLPQLESILEYLDVLNKVDVSDIKPTYRVNHQQNVFHDDEPVESFSQVEALSAAKKTANGYFEVIGTIKK